MMLSEPAITLISKMLIELSTLKYGFVSQVEGCYDYCIYRYGLDVPPEGKQVIIDRVLNILKVNV